MHLKELFSDSLSTFKTHRDDHLTPSFQNFVIIAS